MTIILRTALGTAAMTALGTVLVASLLGGTAAMGQLGDQNRACCDGGDQADSKIQKTADADRNSSHPASPGEATGAPRALDTPQPAATGRPAVSIVAPVQATPDAPPAVSRTATEPS